jgi:hypothetical protein
MKICERCFKEFEEDNTYASPAEELADIFLRDTGRTDVNNLCPRCREEQRIVNLLGFTF